MYTTTTSIHKKSAYFSEMLTVQFAKLPEKLGGIDWATGLHSAFSSLHSGEILQHPQRCHNSELRHV